MRETSHPAGGSEATAAVGPSRHDRAGATESGSAEPDRSLTEDRDRIAAQINDMVVRRLYSVGLALQSALSQLDGDRAAETIQGALGELDQAIIDVRDAVFGTRRADSPHRGPSG